MAHQLRAMILRRVRAGLPVLPEIDGREDTKADVVRALLSGHSPYLVSEEGTGKTRLARSLSRILPAVPVIRGCPYHDDPKWPAELLCPRCRESEDPVRDFGIELLPGPKRFSRIQGNEYTNEAKLLGVKDIQAIARGGSPSDPRIFTGTGVFRANRGILFIDELPVIRTKVQVLLHPILEEKKAILEEYGWEQPLDLVVIATGNPKGFSHVNDIPRPLQDRLEYIHMDLPSEDIEKQILHKERFTSLAVPERNAVSSEDFYISPDEVKRTAAVPWWITDLITKAVRWGRACPHLESRPSVRATVHALDHTCASVEMENRHVADVRHAYHGLKLALRGRMQVRADLKDFDNPGKDFALRDRLVADFMWNVLEDMWAEGGLLSGCDRQKAGAELAFLLVSGGIDESRGRVPTDLLNQHDEIRGIIGKMCSRGREEASSPLESERKLYTSTEKDIVEERGYSALEMLVNLFAHSGTVRLPEKSGIFLCQKLSI
ncbi:MAG: AAA family ATPase [Chloroflexi bacterium]|nr:AAA family ATPase [Chloroflexota bacterium]